MKLENVPQSVYEEMGVVFRDGQAVLTVSPSVSLTIDEKILLAPDEKTIKAFADEITKAGLGEVELFDVKDAQYETEKNGWRRRSFGRVHHHTEYVCCPIRQRKYYTYLGMKARVADVDRDSWEKMALYLVCVVATMTLLVVLGIISSGTSVAASVAIFGAVVAGCLAAMAAVTEDKKEAAIIHSYVGR